MLCILFVYPLLHNALLYAFHALIPDVAMGHPWATLLVIGWKDVTVLLLSAGLVRRKPATFAVIVVVGLVFLTSGRILGIKEVLLPTAIAALSWTYRDKIVLAYQAHAALIRQGLVVAALTLMAFGLGELWYRTVEDIHSGNWYDYDYLVANNQYRCGKLAVVPGTLDSSLEECLGTQLNFYKITYYGYYEALQALFLPVGDSVVFGMLLFNLLAFILFESAPEPSRRASASYALAVLLAVSVFLTLNRFGSLCTVLMVFGYFALGRRTLQSLVVGYATLLLVILGYSARAHYLLGSLTSPETPSNIEHLTFVEMYFPLLRAGISEIGPIPVVSVVVVFAVALWSGSLILQRGSFRAWFIVIYAVGLAAYATAMAFSSLPISLVGLGDQPLPAESNVVKVILNHGLMGFLLYNAILAVVISGTGRVMVSAPRTGSGGSESRQRRWVLGMTTAHMLVYQLVSPYVVSGFVTFAFFMAVWTIMVARLEQGGGGSRYGGHDPNVSQRAESHPVHETDQ